MDTEKSRYKVFLDELIGSAKMVVAEYDKRVVILSDEENPILPEIMNRFNRIGVDYYISFNGMPKEAINPYIIHLRELDICQ